MPSLCNVTDAVCKRAPYLSRCYVNGAPVDSAGNPAYMAMYKRLSLKGTTGLAQGRVAPARFWGALSRANTSTSGSPA